MQHFYSGCISRWGFLIRLYFQVGIFNQVVFPGEIFNQDVFRGEETWKYCRGEGQEVLEHSHLEGNLVQCNVNVRRYSQRYITSLL